MLCIIGILLLAAKTSSKISVYAPKTCGPNDVTAETNCTGAQVDAFGDVCCYATFTYTDPSGQTKENQKGCFQDNSKTNIESNLPTVTGYSQVSVGACSVSYTPLSCKSGSVEADTDCENEMISAEGNVCCLVTYTDSSSLTKKACYEDSSASKILTGISSISTFKNPTVTNCSTSHPLKTCGPEAPTDGVQCIYSGEVDSAGNICCYTTYTDTTTNPPTDHKKCYQDKSKSDITTALENVSGYTSVNVDICTDPYTPTTCGPAAPTSAVNCTSTNATTTGYNCCYVTYLDSSGDLQKNCFEAYSKFTLFKGLFGISTYRNSLSVSCSATRYAFSAALILLAAVLF